MCGIAGFFSVSSHANNSSLVQKIADSQEHRGPDAKLIKEIPLANANCTLGHNRLSILDLNDRSNQPFFDSTGTISLIFNGEIYNYIELRDELVSLGHDFKTTGDTEVIVEAYKEWGEDFIKKANGMFAIAILDIKKEKLILIRDRFGVKPLYLFEKPEFIAFASTGKTIAQEFSLKPNLEYLYKGIKTWNFDDDSKTSQYENLDMVKPGHMVIIQPNGDKLSIEEKKWYNLEANTIALKHALIDLSEDALCQRVMDVLQSAIDIRLRSDVPVAVALSGGLDSGAVASLIGRTHKEVKAFSFGDPNDQESEGPLAKLIAEKAGINISFIAPSIPEMTGAFDSTLKYQDAPFVSGSQVAQYLVAKQVKEEGYTVLLGGQGGDEGFMGYRKYFLFSLKSAMAKKQVGKALSMLIQISQMAKAEGSNLGAYWRHRGRFSGSTDEQTGFLQFPTEWKPPSVVPPSGEEVWKRQMQDITQLSLPTLLRYEDRNGMAHSIESRLPFLDYRLLELGLALPEVMKVRKGFGKWVIRQVTEDIVPDEIRLARYKRGFPIDQKAWIASGLGQKLRNDLNDVLPNLKSNWQFNENQDQTFTDEALIENIYSMPEILSLIWAGRAIN